MASTELPWLGSIQYFPWWTKRFLSIRSDWGEWILPVVDRSCKSRQDWNGLSRRRPRGDSIWYNCFSRWPRIVSNCIPITFGSILLNFSPVAAPAERRCRGKSDSNFSDWGSNEPSSLGNSVSPGGPYGWSESVWRCVESKGIVPVDQVNPKEERIMCEWDNARCRNTHCRTLFALSASWTVRSCRTQSDVLALQCGDPLPFVPWIPTTPWRKKSYQ